MAFTPSRAFLVFFAMMTVLYAPTVNAQKVNVPYILKDINPGTASSKNTLPNCLVYCKNVFYFFADDGIHGRELWKTNGTSAGTKLVKDINPGTASVTAESITIYNDCLYFMADDGTHGSEVWKSDGTTAGTVMLKEISPGNKSTIVYCFLTSKGSLFFFARDNQYYEGWWKSDGTTNGTVMSTSYGQQVAGYSMRPSLPVPYGDDVYFRMHASARAYDPSFELFRINNGSPVQVVNLITNPGEDEDVGNFTVHNNMLYFTACNGKIWKTNGTAAGTTLVKDLYPSSPRQFASSGGYLYFYGITKGTWPYLGEELWRSDGTDDGTYYVKDINSAGSSEITNMTSFNGAVYFFANSTEFGNELWRSKGTASTTSIVKDIFPGTGSAAGTLKAASKALYFSATDPYYGSELWISDGTPDGTKRMADIYPDEGNASPADLTVTPEFLCFTADDGVHGREPWFVRTVAKTGCDSWGQYR